MKENSQESRRKDLTIGEQLTERRRENDFPSNVRYVRRQNTNLHSKETLTSTELPCPQISPIGESTETDMAGSNQWVKYRIKGQQEDSFLFARFRGGSKLDYTRQPSNTGGIIPNLSGN